MTGLSEVKALIVDLLAADTDLGTLLDVNPAGNVPVYLGWQFGKHPVLPSVTVTNIAEQGEVSGLNDGFDGSNRYEWSYAVVQVDVWAADEDSRDSITAQIRKVLLRSLSELMGIGATFPSSNIAVLNEAKRLIFRHSLRYTVFYSLAAEVS